MDIIRGEKVDYMRLHICQPRVGLTFESINRCRVFERSIEYVPETQSKFINPNHSAEDMM